MNIVWFKKDLRVIDHEALAEALSAGNCVALFIFEPEWFQSPEFDQIHLNFAIESLKALKIELQKLGVPLIFKHGSAVSVFQEIFSQHQFRKIFSHEETGLMWTYERDLKVKAWAQEKSISWFEFKQFAVVRGLKNRDLWLPRRQQFLRRNVFQPRSQSLVISPWNSGEDLLESFSKSQPARQCQKGGLDQATRVLETFLNSRGERYFQAISSPQKAFEGCSRLSPYLTWGNISLREVLKKVETKRREIKNSPNSGAWNLSLRHFESRLAWHCHFIQKLESEPEIEFENFNREFDGMRESEFNQSHFQAWCRGETGFPMIDACMRALKQHGWINFRMRAMLMSFATYQLWLHWKKPAEYLARNFVDFEPGIHYSQAQMQSGVTGINSIRIYSPRKQALDQDPTGEFIRKYIPELGDVPLVDLAEPHKMPPLLRAECSLKLGESYPHPIVDPEQSYKNAKQKIFDWKKQSRVQAASKAVFERHGSRKSL